MLNNMKPFKVKTDKFSGGIPKKSLNVYWRIFKYSLLFFLFSLSVYGGYMFYETHDFRSPVLFQNPFPSKYKRVLLSPKNKIPGKTTYVNLGDIADKIYTLESSRGKHVNCPSGTYNGYGWRQNSSEWICYQSQEEVREQVIAWLSKTLSKHTLEETLCIYNRGINESGCTYAMNFKSL